MNISCGDHFIHCDGNIHRIHSISVSPKYGQIINTEVVSTEGSYTITTTGVIWSFEGQQFQEEFLPYSRWSSNPLQGAQVILLERMAELPNLPASLAKLLKMVLPSPPVLALEIAHPASLP
jgi:hypothetical protein